MNEFRNFAHSTVLDSHHLLMRRLTFAMGGGIMLHKRFLHV
jgi:hypothetical protein